MISRPPAITMPGTTPATNSLGIDSEANWPNFSTASGGGFMPSAEMPKITIGIDGGMMMPRPPEAAVTADA